MRRMLSLALVLALVLPVGTFVRPEQAAADYQPPDIKVAVVRSQASQDWVDKYKRGYGILLKQGKVYDWLTSKGWKVEYINDADLENINKLKQYDAVVCMWVFAMSPAASRTVTRYVAEGGGLVTLYASSRVAPGVGGNERDDHWVYIMNHQGWEWGPLSEVNQTYFIDDVGAMKFRANPVWGHPIVTGAAGILSARGHNNGDMTLYRDQNPGAWVELPKMLSGNTNTSQFMTMTQLSTPTGSKSYPGTHPGAVASTYLGGRMAYFYFSPTDMLPNFNQDGSADRVLSTGVKQGEVSAAYIEAAIGWAAGSGGRPGVLVRDGRTNATLNVYQDGIYASQYVTNRGNVSVTGNLHFRVFSPSGAKVREVVLYKIGTEPGETNRYSHQYVVSRLEPGTYRVEVEYHTTYPLYERRYVETAYVYRGQGTNIPTVFDRQRTNGQVVYDPRVVRHAGDNRYRTALAIADAAGGYPRQNGYVVVASGEGGADALVASGVAGAYDAPLVLTRQDLLPAVVESWMTNKARGFSQVIIVGGEAAVSSAVEGRLRTLFGQGNVKRLAGDDRYGTSAAVARDMKEQLGRSYDGGMVVANGRALVDAAAASAIAAGRKWPIIYVRSNSVPAEPGAAVSEITSDTTAPLRAWIAGGTAVVGTGVETELKALQPRLTISRAAGADRYDTAAKLSDLASASGSSWNTVGMASGVSLADALCLGSLVGRANGPMLLTNGASMTVPTENRIKNNKSQIRTVAVGGGVAVVRHDVTARISSLLP